MTDPLTTTVSIDRPYPEGQQIEQGPNVPVQGMCSSQADDLTPYGSLL